MNSRLERRHNFFRWAQYGLWIVFFMAAYLICLKIQYTDGDDAFFYDMAHSMRFFEYIKYRYITWQGRATSEAMTYIAFYFGIGFWRPVNALILTLLPAGLVHLAKKMLPQMDREKEFFLSAFACLMILFMDMEVIGYACIWMTGSTFYLWSIVAGIWALSPIADLAFRGTYRRRDFWFSMPLAFIASMGMEQIAAVAIVFGILAVLHAYMKNRKVELLPAIQTVLMIVGLVVLFISPGTAARSGDEILTWLPQYATMTLGEHIFITVQFLLSALANQSRMFLIVLWTVLAVLFYQKGGRRRYFSLLTTVLILTTFLSYIGKTCFSEMGMGVKDITQCVTEVATWNTISAQNKFAMCWWGMVILVTLVMLWNSMDTVFNQVFLTLLFLGGLACTLIMYFSPTIYASGGRVLFMMEVMFWFLILVLMRQFRDKRVNYWFLVILPVCGLIQFASGISYMCSFF